jgi:hypothetical protein
VSPGRSTFISHALKQTAVYWGDPVSDGAGGRTFGSAYPVEIDCRWEQKADLFIDMAGQETRSRAVVYVSQDLDMGGYLFLGSLSELSGAEQADPLIVSRAYEIRQFQKVPNLKGDMTTRKAWL